MKFQTGSRSIVCNTYDAWGARNPETPDNVESQLSQGILGQPVQAAVEPNAGLRAHRKKGRKPTVAKVQIESRKDIDAGQVQL